MINISTGLDILLDEKCARLKGLRVGLLTNQSSTTHDLRPNVDALRDAGANVVAFFTPEHGLSGAVGHGDRIVDSRDERTGLPIYSLYGETTRPTRAMLENIDILIYDLQDVGVRFYTYTVTLALALEACAEYGTQVLVLDRPDPITGTIVEGPILDPSLQTMVGHGPLPIRFGFTLGELAHFYNRELDLNAKLDVVLMRGWRRPMWFDQLDLQWVPPSPNIPHPGAAMLYPGMCLLEGTNVSVGRGTPLPFEIVGAPFINGYELADSLSEAHMDGVLFRPLIFTPGSDVLANECCSGIQIHITDRQTFRPVTMAMHLLAALAGLYKGKFAWRERGFDRLMGDRCVREKIDRGERVSEIMNAWSDGLERFNEKRVTYLTYA